MACIEIKKGPSPWHLMLAMFDEHPAGAIGARQANFQLQGGQHIHVQVRGVIKPDRQKTLDPWTILGSAAWLPKGYYYSEGVELYWDPFARAGWIDLEITSPCCGASIDSALSDGILVGYCSGCQKAVIRVNPRTGSEEWLNGLSPWAPGDDLEKVERLS